MATNGDIKFIVDLCFDFIISVSENLNNMIMIEIIAS